MILSLAFHNAVHEIDELFCFIIAYFYLIIGLNAQPCAQLGFGNGKGSPDQ